MTVVYFTEEVHGDTRCSYENVKVQVSGWLFCYIDGTDKYEAFPPHMIERVVETDAEGKKPGQRLTAESPHGKI